MNDGIVVSGIGLSPRGNDRPGAASNVSTSPVRSATGLVKAYYTPVVQFPKGALTPGSYVYAIQLTAWANPSRASGFVSEPFTVGSDTTKAEGKTKGKTRGKKGKK